MCAKPDKDRVGQRHCYHEPDEEQREEPPHHSHYGQKGDRGDRGPNNIVSSGALRRGLIDAMPGKEAQEGVDDERDDGRIGHWPYEPRGLTNRA